MKKLNKGITLVALVITIIVLIILAGVSINAVMNGGIITNAKDAKNEFENAKLNETETLGVIEGYIIDNIGTEFEKGMYKQTQQYNTDLANAKSGKIADITNYQYYDEDADANLVTITDGVLTTCIMKDGFPNTSNLIGELTEVYIPKSINEIGAGAFQECISLKKLVIEDGVTTISNGAFSNTGLESVYLPMSVQSIKGYAFQGCSKALKTVTIMNPNVNIEGTAFQDDSKLTEVYYNGTKEQAQEKFSGNKIGYDVDGNKIADVTIYCTDGEIKI